VVKKGTKKKLSMPLASPNPELYRYLGIAQEATYGTAVAPTLFLPIVSERIVPDAGLVVAENVASRSAQKLVQGRFRNAGDIVCHIFPDGITKLFEFALGEATTTQPDAVNAPNTYQHVFVDQDEVKSFTASIGAELLERRIAGCLVNRMEIASVVADQILMATFGIIGGQETKQPIGSPTWPADIDPFATHQTTITIGGIDKSAQVEACRIVVNNNIPDRWGHKSRFEQRIELGPTVVEGSLDLAFVDADQYDAFLAGSEFSLQLKAVGEKIEATYFYTFQVDVHRCVYASDVAPHIDRREPLKLTAPFRALYKDKDDRTIKITVINKETSI